jgi:hypothetical protein
MLLGGLGLLLFIGGMWWIYSKASKLEDQNIALSKKLDEQDKTIKQMAGFLQQFAPQPNTVRRKIVKNIVKEETPEQPEPVEQPEPTVASVEEESEDAVLQEMQEIQKKRQDAAQATSVVESTPITEAVEQIAT